MAQKARPTQSNSMVVLSMIHIHIVQCISGPDVDEEISPPIVNIWPARLLTVLKQILF